MRGGPVILALLACQTPESASDDDTGRVVWDDPFEDPVDPDSEHILVSSLINLDGHALLELRPDLTPTWTHDMPERTGAQGAQRLADGSTVFADVTAPPGFRSVFDLIDADGDLVWSYDDLTAVGFSHGIAVTPEGDFVALDTVGGKVISFDAHGTLLWSMSTSGEDGQFHPNGLNLHDYGDGDVRIAVSMLERTDNGDPDALAVFRLGARDEAPTRLWRTPVALDDGDGAWPHGPRLQDDGTVTVCHSAAAQVVTYDESGVELSRIPPTGDPPRFSFPRDAMYLSDGSLLVADAGAELVRVADPAGEFRVVAAVQVPGIFGVSRIECGDGGGLPCLGE